MEPTDNEIQEATKELVKSVRDKGEIQHWTKALIRERLETQFKLPSGELKTRKALINDVVDELLNEDDAEGDKENQSPPSGSKKGKGKAKKASEQREEVDKSDSELSGRNDESLVSKGKNAKTKKPAKAKLATGESKARRADRNTDAFLSMVGLGPSSAGADEQAALMIMQGLTGGAGGMESDSELSVLEDEPPRKKARPSNDASGPKKRKTSKKEPDLSDEEKPKKSKSRRESKPKTNKKEAKPLDKDEETIKRLKSFVVACGIRKQWAKEFDGMTKPSQQISHLKKILSDLGMTGRYSLEQAKAIRDKRELQQEIQDVINFDASINGPRGSRQKTRALKVSAGDSDHQKMEVDAEEGETDDDDAPPVKSGKKRARNSILAFLDDQSESD
ncbi:hypothetical protein FRC02_004331 [Tulasnella sp. 418]|nr:hypothetical protein FRC02_004331 [Tulasnella sp. 418]